MIHDYLHPPLHPRAYLDGWEAIEASQGPKARLNQEGAMIEHIIVSLACEDDSVGF